MCFRSSNRVWRFHFLHTLTFNYLLSFFIITILEDKKWHFNLGIIWNPLMSNYAKWFLFAFGYLHFNYFGGFSLILFIISWLEILTIYFSLLLNILLLYLINRNKNLISLYALNFRSLILNMWFIFIFDTVYNEGVKKEPTKVILYVDLHISSNICWKGYLCISVIYCVFINNKLTLHETLFLDSQISPVDSLWVSFFYAFWLFCQNFLNKRKRSFIVLFFKIAILHI